MSISREVDLIRRNIRMRQFVATFHLKLVYTELINAFDLKSGFDINEIF